MFRKLIKDFLGIGVLSWLEEVESNVDLILIREVEFIVGPWPFFKQLLRDDFLVLVKGEPVKEVVLEYEFENGAFAKEDSLNFVFDADEGHDLDLGVLHLELEHPLEGEEERCLEFQEGF